MTREQIPTSGKPLPVTEFTITSEGQQEIAGLCDAILEVPGVGRLTERTWDPELNPPRDSRGNRLATGLKQLKLLSKHGMVQLEFTYDGTERGGYFELKPSQRDPQARVVGKYFVVYPGTTSDEACSSVLVDYLSTYDEAVHG